MGRELAKDSAYIKKPLISQRFFGYFLDNVGEFSSFEGAVKSLAFASSKLNFAGFGGDERIVTSAENIGTSVDFGATLTDNNHTGVNNFAFVFFDTETLGAGIAAKSGGAAGFLMCHTGN